MKPAVLACLLIAAMFGCLLHVEGGLEHVACGLQGMAALALAVSGTLLLTDRRFLHVPSSPGKVPAYAASFFHPPEVRA
ncbi:MAG: hypothetical protein WAP47_18310 [Candidatus Rokuibacteriota bacterium]